MFLPDSFYQLLFRASYLKSLHTCFPNYLSIHCALKNDLPQHGYSSWNLTNNSLACKRIWPVSITWAICARTSPISSRIWSGEDKKEQFNSIHIQRVYLKPARWILMFLYIALYSNCMPTISVVGNTIVLFEYWSTDSVILFS